MEGEWLLSETVRTQTSRLVANSGSHKLIRCARAALGGPVLATTRVHARQTSPPAMERSGLRVTRPRPCGGICARASCKRLILRKCTHPGLYSQHMRAQSSCYEREASALRSPRLVALHARHVAVHGLTVELYDRARGHSPKQQWQLQPTITFCSLARTYH